MFIETPKNFSWLGETRIAALAFPETTSQLNFLMKNNIGYLVTLSKELKPPVNEVPQLKWIDIGIEDFSTFSLDQVETFIAVCEEAARQNTGVAVHCRAGKGRTGTMLACYLIRFRGLEPKDAIDEVRRQRPSSIETEDQENTIFKYSSYLKSSSSNPVL